jgi:hypothetical protein
MFDAAQLSQRLYKRMANSEEDGEDKGAEPLMLINIYHHNLG